jgi:phosphoserine phosphatase
MAQRKSDKKALPSSIRLPEDLKKALEDYCWLNHTSINALTVDLLEKFIKDHPLTPQQKKFIEDHRKKG